MTTMIKPIQSSDVFELTLQPGLSLDDRAHCCDLDEVIFSWSPETEQKLTTKRKTHVKVQILWFEDDLEPDEMLKILRKLDHKPAHFGHLLAFAAQEKKFIGQIAALGTIEKNDEWRRAPVLVASNPEDGDDHGCRQLAELVWDPNDPDAIESAISFNAIDGGEMGVLVLAN